MQSLQALDSLPFKILLQWLASHTFDACVRTICLPAFGIIAGNFKAINLLRLVGLKDCVA